MRMIKKIFLAICIILTAANISIAQTFSNTPNDTIATIGMMEDFQQLIIQQLNISSSNITLKWKKVSQSIPSGWDASVCDNQICYPALVDSGMMNPVSPGNTGYLLIDITPHINYGTAIIRYEIWDIAYPSLKDTLTFMHTVNTVGIDNLEIKNTYHVFPNPATEYINIISASQPELIYSIIDVTGKEIKSGSLINSTSIYINDLNDGIYFIQIKLNNQIHIQKFVKQ